MIEDVLVKVDKFIFHTNFIIFNMEDDNGIPIILGYIFLAIRRTLINMHRGELIMRVQNDEVKFKVFEPSETLYKVNKQEEVKAIHSKKKREYGENKNKNKK